MPIYVIWPLTIIRALLASETVITMLPSSPEVRTVYGEGIIPALRKLSEDEARSTLCIDSTTLDIMVAKRVAADVVNARAQMVDAPVSGGMLLGLPSSLFLILVARCDWCKSCHPVVPHWGHGGSFQSFATHTFSHGSAHHPLWPVWLWFRCKDLQQCKYQLQIMWLFCA